MSEYNNKIIYLRYNNTSELVKIIDFWREVALKGPLLPRVIADQINIPSREVIDLTGVRRSGKSFILKLLIRKIPDNWLYMNFEDPFFLENNNPAIIEALIETYKSNFASQPKYLFLDEIQNIKKWESAVRKFRDEGGYKIFITGSSAKLLSQELSTLLSGRHLSYEVFPLSFDEFLNFRGLKIEAKKDLILKEKILLKNFGDYLQIGGFPEVVLTGDTELLKQYYGDIIQRDIIVRHQIRDKEALQQMGAFLISSAGKTVSLLSLQDQYQLTFKAVSAYLSFFKESFLIFELPRFSFSLRTQQKALKKVYCVDTGLANMVSFRFSQDRGRMLENAVFLHLRRQKREIYYFRGDNENEVDFVVKDQGEVKELIQVAWDVGDQETLSREIRGLKEAVKTVGAKKLTILTYETSGEENVGNLKVQLKPVYRWILENEKIISTLSG